MPVHIIAPIGATFLRQRVAQWKANSKCLRVESSIGDASRGPPSGDPPAEEYVDPTIAMEPKPPTSNTTTRSMSETVLTVQFAHGQLLLDLIYEVATLWADLAASRDASPPPDQSWLPFGNTSQKGGVHRDRGSVIDEIWDRGSSFFYEIGGVVFGCFFFFLFFSTNFDTLWFIYYDVYSLYDGYSL